MSLQQQLALHSQPIGCPHHPEATLIEDYRAGDQICSVCGLVVGDRVIDPGSEWRSHPATGPNPSRVGPAENPLLDSSSDLSTMIAGGRGEAAFTETGTPKYAQRGQVEQGDRVLLAGFKAIGGMADRLGVPKVVVDRACVVLKTYLTSTRTSSAPSHKLKVEPPSAAALYIACRLESTPRTFKEILATTSASKKEMSGCYKQVMRALGTEMDSVTTDDFMERFCGNLGLPRGVQVAAREIARRGVGMGLVAGRSPISVSAAAIYMASQASSEKRTQKQISAVAGVADVTIRQAYKLLYPKADRLFPAGFAFATPIDQLPLL